MHRPNVFFLFQCMLGIPIQVGIDWSTGVSGASGGRELTDEQKMHWSAALQEFGQPAAKKRKTAVQDTRASVLKFMRKFDNKLRN